MKLFYSTTSPYARLARIVLAEKRAPVTERTLTDPWKDDPALLAANPSARVPTLVLDSGRTLTESLLIVLWLEARHPEPALLPGNADAVLSRAGIAMGAIDAAAAVIIGRKMTDALFDESPVGLRRRRSVIGAMRRLEADPPVYAGGTPDLAVITAVIAIDYLRFRFPTAAWLPPLPRLGELAGQLAGRASFDDTRPCEMPAA